MNLNIYLKVFVFILLLTICTKAQIFEKTIKILPPKSDEIPYFYVPFDVPVNTKSLSFSYEYDKTNGLNRLEFGVFETGFNGMNNDKNGFRGWSGSVRDTAFIAKNAATHGYSAGDIQPGKWYFIIGLAKVSHDGVDVKLKVKFNQIDEKPLREFETETKKTFSAEKIKAQKHFKTNEYLWFRGDLHAHTFHGDGSWSVKGILDSAASNNLDFVALTEHNTFTHHREIDLLSKNYPNLLIIRGEEVTTYGGHIGIWGLPSGKWVDFRVIPNLKSSSEQIVNEAHKLNALASINHPTLNCPGCTWSYDNNWENFDSVEIWNATWSQEDEEALKIWDKFLQQGRTITAVGSSDSHQPPYEPSTYTTNLRIGNPTVFIGAKRFNQEELFNGIKNGRVIVAENPNYSIKFTADNNTSVGDKIITSQNQTVKLNISLKGFPVQSKLLVIENGRVLKQSDFINEAFSESLTLKIIKDGYVRLEIRSQEGKMLAFTNPIYFRIK